MMNDLKSLTTASKILRLSRQRVHTLYKAGEFPNAQMVEGLILIPESDIRNFQLKKKGA